MNTLGAQLREARENKGVSPSEAAAATHIKIQIIEDLEHDRFHRTYAPVYAKGFIRLYGEYLEMDTSTLIAEYEAQKPAAAKPVDVVQNKQQPRRSIIRDKTKQTSDQPESTQPRPPVHATVVASIKPIIERVRRLPWADLKKRLRPPRKPAVRRQPAISAPPDEIDDRDSAIQDTRPGMRSPAWLEHIRNVMRGPHRMLAAAVVVAVLLSILIVIGFLAARRRAATPDANQITPDTERLPSQIEFFHPPPPPYN